MKNETIFSADIKVLVFGVAIAQTPNTAGMMKSFLILLNYTSSISNNVQLSKHIEKHFCKLLSIIAQYQPYSILNAW
jgi:hypothetical protein